MTKQNFTAKKSVLQPSVKVGDTFTTNSGCTVKVIVYENSRNVTVEFQDEHRHTVKTILTNIRLGNVKNPYLPSVWGMGYIGYGRYKTRKDGKASLEYQTWKDMIERCYNTSFHATRPTYIGCSVCLEWLNFQVFAEWYTNHLFYGLGYHLDKDILVEGNKIYSAETCCLVPAALNGLLNDRSNDRGNHPQGVSWYKQSSKYFAQISIDGKRKYLGFFHCPHEAEAVYKKAKQDYVKIKIEEWKGRVEDCVITALYREIERLD